jgi:hypothetical protein
LRRFVVNRCIVSAMGKELEVFRPESEGLAEMELHDRWTVELRDANH